jgi:hypothetical protein
MAGTDPLNSKQERFCQLVVAGNSQAESYRQAYASKGTVQTCAEEGSRFMALLNIRTRVKELRDVAISDAWVHLDNHLNSLKEIRQAAFAAENFSAATSAQVAMGKACGHGMEKKIDLSNTDGSLSQIDFSKLSPSRLNALKAILYPGDDSNEPVK